MRLWLKVAPKIASRPLWGPPPRGEERHEGQEGPHEAVADPVLHPVAEVHHELGGCRKLATEVLEHLLEGWNDLHQHQDHHADGDHQDRGGIDHRALHLSPQGVGLLQVDRQAIQDGVEDAADLAGLNEVHVEGVEGLGVLSQGVREGGALLPRRSSRRAGCP